MSLSSLISILTLYVNLTKYPSVEQFLTFLIFLEDLILVLVFEYVMDSLSFFSFLFIQAKTVPWWKNILTIVAFQFCRCDTLFVINCSYFSPKEDISKN